MSSSDIKRFFRVSGRINTKIIRVSPPRSKARWGDEEKTLFCGQIKEDKKDYRAFDFFNGLTGGINEGGKRVLRAFFFLFLIVIEGGR